jgi:hypothetical protein
MPTTPPPRLATKMDGLVAVSNQWEGGIVWDRLVLSSRRNPLSRAVFSHAKGCDTGSNFANSLTVQTRNGGVDALTVSRPNQFAATRTFGTFLIL